MVPIQLTEQDVVERLEAGLQLERSSIYPEYSSLADHLPNPIIPAAVLVPMFQVQMEWRILFTRRTENLPEHSGQVAFPGGRADPDDLNSEATAVREAYEEIGIKPLDVRILGHLQSYITITSYQVTPVVGNIPWPYPFRLAHQEVSRLFSVPLSWLADPANFDLIPRDLPLPYPPVMVIYYHDYDGEIIWGATARMTQALLIILGLLKM